MGGHTGKVWFHSVTWRHHTSKKTTLIFYLSVRHARVRVLFFHQFGRPWVQNIGFVDVFRDTFLFFWISTGNGRIWRKSEKRGFLDGQKQANMAIFVSRSQVFLTISQGSIIFFLIEDMSVMCLSLVTKCVRLKGKELQFFENWWFFWKFHYRPGLSFLHLLWWRFWSSEPSVRDSIFLIIKLARADVMSMN